VEHRTDVDAAIDQLRPGALDVRHRQLQPLG
jgi:hypothetical protein